MCTVYKIYVYWWCKQDEQFLAVVGWLSLEVKLWLMQKITTVKTFQSHEYCRSWIRGSCINTLCNRCRSSVGEDDIINRHWSLREQDGCHNSHHSKKHDILLFSSCWYFKFVEMQCLDKDLQTRKWFRLYYFLLQISKPGVQRQSLHKDQIVLRSCELIIAFCSNVTHQRAPKGPTFAKSTILKKTFGNQSRDLPVLTQKCTTFIFHGFQHLWANNVHVHWDCLCETLQRGQAVKQSGHRTR